MEIVQTILQILGYIVPALVVYFLMRQFLNGHLATEQMKIRMTQSGEDKGLRIQAYERLTLLCERLNISSLMMRLNTSEMDNNHLKNAMLISIQKEYEHNLTQQIYVSGQLWEMVGLLKDNVMAAVTQSFEEHGTGDKATFENQMMQLGATINGSIAAKVKEAIRKEVELYFR